MKKIILTVALIAGLTASAQVKVGANPTTLATNAVLQAEGSAVANQFVVLQNGNVGIGTTAPTYKLDVNGVIRAGGSPTVGGLILADNYGSGPIFTLGNHQSSAGPVIGYGAKPKVGAGGFVSSTSTSISKSVIYINNPGINFLTAPQTTDAIDADLTLTSKFFISNAGNVGIGTTAPTSKLQVVGLPVHATNAAALTAGLTAGAFYHAGDGIVRVVF